MQFDTSTIQATEFLLMKKYQKSVLTVQEAACELAVEESDVEQMIRESRLPLVSIGCSQRISVASLARVLDGVTLDPVHYPATKHLVNDILDEVLEEKKKSCRKLSSYSWYCYHAKHIRNYFVGIYVEDVDSGRLYAFLKQIVRNQSGKQMSQKFVQTITRLLKNVVSYAIEQEYIIKNPFANIKKLPCGKKTNSKKRYISKKNVLRLVEVLDSSPVFKPMVILLLRSGLRIGEVLALHWSDLDPENGLIHVENGLSLEYDEDENGNLINKRYEIGDTKTPCSVRDIPVDDKVFQALDECKRNVNSKPKLLEAIKRKGNEDIIFVTRFGSIRSYQALRKSFKRFLASHGLGDIPITFHKFRHTYATLLSEAGVDSDIIRELLGHSDISTTDNIYINVSLTPMRRASKILSHALENIR